MLCCLLIVLLLAHLAGESQSYAESGLPPPNANENEVTQFVSWEQKSCCGDQRICPHSVSSNQQSVELTASLLNPANRLKLFAGLDTLMVFSTKRPFPSGLPLFLLPDSPFGLDTHTFDLHARQTYVGALFSGPDLGSFRTGAQILAFLQNDNLTADEYGLLVYYAYGELKNDDWRFAAGLQQDVFNPVSPTVVYLTKMYASGNTGSYRGQVRVERFFQHGNGYGMTLQMALSDPLSTLISNRAGRITEDNGWPNVEARMEFGIGPLCEKRGSQSRSLEVGVSGIVGQFRTSESLLANPPVPSPRATINTWGVGTDVEWRPNAWWGARGEFYYGQGLGEYNGGILQSFNSTNFQEIQTRGGFGEIYCYLTDDFHVHVGYGIDDPRDSDLAPTQIRRNQTYFANLVWDLSKSVQLGLEIDYRKTDYTQFLPNAFLDSDAVIVATRFLWKF